MELYDEAAKISIFGIEIYAYGLHIAIGILAMTIALWIITKQENTKKGTVLLIVLTGTIIGGVFSRLFFCLMDQSLGSMIPFKYWFYISGGGWSMTGLIAGFFFAAWISAKISRQEVEKILDFTACTFPLLMIAERLGERLIDDFNMSRPLGENVLTNSFLVCQGEYENYLRTYYLCAAGAFILFLCLNILNSHKHQDGEIWIDFLLVCGAGGVILESLRYDYFLSITFVHLQQVCFALMLLTGTIIAAVRVKTQKTVLRFIAPVSVLLAAGAVIAIEFAIDRSDINNLLLYAVMVLVLSVPVALGMKLNYKKGQENR